MGCLKMLVPVYACRHCSSFGEYKYTKCPYANEYSKRVDPFDPKSETFKSCSHLKLIQMGTESFLVCTSQMAVSMADPFPLPDTNNWKAGNHIQADYEYSQEAERRAGITEDQLKEDVKENLYHLVGARLIEELFDTPDKEALVRVHLIGGKKGDEPWAWDFVKLQAFTFTPKKELEKEE